ncbi:adenylate cyclase domain protein [Mycobacterium xenopi 3993]|nr:adenylate cyclase domain protein [Mycobacterium xenopi 3993]
MPQEVYERLKDDFVLEERGDVEVKGKGVMHTWYLVGRKPGRGRVACIVAHRKSPASDACPKRRTQLARYGTLR